MHCKNKLLLFVSCSAFLLSNQNVYTPLNQALRKMEMYNFTSLSELMLENKYLLMGNENLFFFWIKIIFLANKQTIVLGLIINES